MKQHDKIIGFFEVDGPYHYRIDKMTGKKKLRRADQLKEFLYRLDYPDVPFIRVDTRDAVRKTVLASAIVWKVCVTYTKYINTLVYLM
jgi:hypothetical protein